MENGPVEDVFPIQDGDFLLPCYFTGGYFPVFSQNGCLHKIHGVFFLANFGAFQSTSSGFWQCHDCLASLVQWPGAMAMAFLVPNSGIPRNTPWKINMEHNHGGLEDHFPF